MILNERIKMRKQEKKLLKLENKFGRKTLDLKKTY